MKGSCGVFSVEILLLPRGQLDSAKLEVEVEV